MPPAEQHADDALPFPFLHHNARPPKPRTTGLTEIRGPYYTMIGPRGLRDLLELSARYVDSLKFAGGAFALLPARAVKEMIDLCHEFSVSVSTGGFVEYVLTQGPQAVDRYVDRCAELGFDWIEISAGFVVISLDDTLRLIDRVHRAGLKAKAEVGIQFGAGGASAAGALAAEGTRDVAWAVDQALRMRDGGAEMIMLESEGVTESVGSWRTEVPAKFATALGLRNLMFEAADPEAFAWYIKNFGPDVNLFVDHSQILQLECLRAGIWGTQSLWGRVVGYPAAPQG